MPYDVRREGEHAGLGYITGDRLLVTMGLAGAFVLGSSMLSHASDDEASLQSLVESSSTSLETSTTLSSSLSSSLDQVSQLALAISDSSIAITTSIAIDTATSTISDLNSAITAAESATTLASLATLQQESMTVTQLESLIESQTALVITYQQEADNANALAQDSITETTYTETFANNTISTPLLITSDGSTVTSTPVNNTSIGGNWSTTDDVVSGSALVLMGPTQDVTITFLPDDEIQGNVTSVSFGVYAKNGDATMEITTVFGNTFTEIIQDNVSPSYPGYVHVETITVSSSESIDTVVIPKDSDYYIIDNITFVVSSVNPELALQAHQAQEDLVSQQESLALLTDTRDAITTMISSLDSVNSYMISAQLAVANAQVVVSEMALTSLQDHLNETQDIASSSLSTSTTQLIFNAQQKINEATALVQAALIKKNEFETYQLSVNHLNEESLNATIAQLTNEIDELHGLIETQQSIVNQFQEIVDSKTQQGLKVEVWNNNDGLNSYNASPLLPDVDENREPDLTFIDDDGISENFENLGPDNYYDDYVIKWSGYWTPTYTGTQYVYAPADDGVRLYLDDVLVIDDWFDKGGGGSTADIETVEGVSKKFELYFYENGGGSHVALMRYTGSGWEIIPVSEFTYSTATEQELLDLSLATSTLTTLQSSEQQISSELVSSQVDLLLVQSANNSRGEYLELSSQAISTTIEALALTHGARDHVIDQTHSVTPPPPPLPPVTPSSPSEEPPVIELPIQPEPEPDNEISPSDPDTETQEQEQPELDLEEPTQPESPQDDSTSIDEDDSEIEEPDLPVEEEVEEPDQELQDPIQEDLKPKPQDPSVKPLPEKEIPKLELPKSEENVPSKDNTPQPDDIKNLVKDLLKDNQLTAQERQVIATALVSAFINSTGSVPAAALAEAGLRAKDLPPETPLQLDNGVIIEAQVQAAFEVLANPGELLSALFENPAQVLMALTNLGADMSPEVREDSQKVVVTSVIAAGVAVQAAAAATAAAASSSSSSSGGVPAGREGKTNATKARGRRTTPRSRLKK